MAAVPPIDDWALPAGFAYDESIDAIANSAHTVILNPEDYWGPVDYLYIVPLGRTADVDAMIAAGVIPTGMVDVYILSADVATVRAAHAVEIDGAWYTVIDAGHAPVGTGTIGNWAMVRLQRRS